MQLWYTIFIFTFITLYGTLSFALLGSWAYESVKSLRDVRRRPARRTSNIGA
ncbi:MAG: hypothetical protein VST65_05865 [Nitrospirota bacterium]|nr:hypothetical protein [Nitrospirota bacterium]